MSIRAVKNWQLARRLKQARRELSVIRGTHVTWNQMARLIRVSYASLINLINVGMINDANYYRIKTWLDNFNRR